MFTASMEGGYQGEQSLLDRRPHNTWEFPSSDFSSQCHTPCLHNSFPGFYTPPVLGTPLLFHSHLKFTPIFDPIHNHNNTSSWQQKLGTPGVQTGTPRGLAPWEGVSWFCSSTDSTSLPLGFWQGPFLSASVSSDIVCITLLFKNFTFRNAPSALSDGVKPSYSKCDLRTSSFGTTGEALEFAF